MSLQPDVSISSVHSLTLTIFPNTEEFDSPSFVTLAATTGAVLGLAGYSDEHFNDRYGQEAVQRKIDQLTDDISELKDKYRQELILSCKLTSVRAGLLCLYDNPA